MNELPARSVLILGYGREGQSVRRYIERLDPGISIAVADRNDGNDYLNKLREYPIIVRSPGVDMNIPELQFARKKGAWMTSATNIFFSVCPGLIVGITGTKGKSTTSALITDILKTTYPDVRLVGNIGNPALDFLEGSTKKTIFVMELSSHQLEDIRYSPHIAVVLNIVPEHLDYYKSFDRYKKAKSNIVSFQREEDFVVYNPLLTESAAIAVNAKSTKITYTPSIENKLESPLRGDANRENILAAVSVGRILGVSDKKIAIAVSAFKTLEHRLEFVGTYNGISFYNDSLATVPEATIHALQALGDQVVTLITGGYDRLLNYDSLGLAIAHSVVLNLILLPDTGIRIESAVRLADPKTNISVIPVRTMEEAVKAAFKLTPPGKICILSPASASFNMFKDYKERGDAFKRAVREYGHQKHS